LLIIIQKGCGEFAAACGIYFFFAIKMISTTMPTPVTASITMAAMIMGLKGGGA
jgi:hypothetical protein